MTSFHTLCVDSVDDVCTRLLCGMRTRPAVAGLIKVGSAGKDSQRAQAPYNDTLLSDAMGRAWMP